MPAVEVSLLCQIVNAGSGINFDAAMLANLIHYWKFEEIAGNDRADSVGTAVFQEIGGPVSDVVGKHGRAIAGPSGGADLASTANVSLGAGSVQTFAFWMNMNSLPGTQMGCFRYANFDHPVITFLSDGTLLFARNLGPGVIQIPLGSLGVWHLVVLVTSGATWSASVDAALFTSAAGFALTGGGLAEFIFVTTDLYDGLMDEFAIWNRAFTQAEVTSLWNNGVGRFLA